MPKRKIPSSIGGVFSQPVEKLPEADLFSLIPVQLTEQSSTLQEINPIGGFAANNDITFSLQGNPSELIDMKSLRIRAELCIKNGDGTDLTPNVEVAPSANLAGALFRNVLLKIGDTSVVTMASNMYPYESYLKMAFKTPSFVQQQQDYPMCLFLDAYDHFDDHGEDNPGFRSRDRLAAGSESIFLRFPLLRPITQQNRLLLPNINVQIRLQLNDPAFTIMSFQPPAEANQKIVIKSFSLEVRRVVLNSELHMNIMKTLQASPAIYPVPVTKTISFTKMQGVTSVSETLISNAKLPQRVHLFIIDAVRVIGSYTMSPYEQNFRDLSEVWLSSGGHIFPDSKPYKTNFAKRNSNRLWLDMLKSCGALDKYDNNIDYPSYLGGYGLISISLLRSDADGSEPLIEAGNRVVYVEINPNNFLYFKAKLEIWYCIAHLAPRYRQRPASSAF